MKKMKKAAKCSKRYILPNTTRMILLVLDASLSFRSILNLCWTLFYFSWLIQASAKGISYAERIEADTHSETALTILG